MGHFAFHLEHTYKGHAIKGRIVSMTEKINTECHKCGKKFETLGELGTHMEEMHDEMQRKRIVRRQKPKKRKRTP